MPAKIKVTQKNPQALARIAARYKDGYAIKVGYPQGKADVTYPVNKNREDRLKSLGIPSDRRPPPTVKEIAVGNEFGVEEQHIPARPFMKLSTPNLIKLMISFFRRRVHLVNTLSETFKHMAEEFAPLAEDVCKKTITDLRTPPNAPLTVFLKQSDNPLIEGGLMRQTLTSDVKKLEK